MLPLLAAAAGAGSVTAVERSRMLYRMARQVLDKSRCRFLRPLSEIDINLCLALTPPPSSPPLHGFELASWQPPKLTLRMFAPIIKGSPLCFPVPWFWRQLISAALQVLDDNTAELHVKRIHLIDRRLQTIGIEGDCLMLT